jgi:uncharacterized protein
MLFARPSILVSQSVPLSEDDCAPSDSKLLATYDSPSDDCSCSSYGLARISNRLSVADSDDCAPSFGGFSAVVTQLPREHYTPLRISDDLYRAPLDRAHELIFNLPGSAQVLVLNEPARSILNSFTSPRTLSEVWIEDMRPEDTFTTARQLFELGALSAIDQPSRWIRSRPQTLTAWLHLTNACNLRCAYCYVPKSAESMSEDTGQQAIDAVFRTARQAGFAAVNLKYAGGEPTLKFDLLKVLQRQARALAAQTRIGLQATMLSNGVSLTRAMVDYLHAENIRLSISIDGLGLTHDAQRPLINGRGSFDRVTRAIDRALAGDLRPHLSITVTPPTADRLAEIVAFALEHELPFNLNFARDCEADRAPQNPEREHECLIAGLRAAFAVIEARLPRQRFIDGLLDRSAFNAPHEYTCGVGRSYVVIDHHGLVSRCQMDMAHPISQISAADILHDIQVNPADFQAVPVTAKTDCADCTWRYWCAGGCPLLTRRVSGRADVKSPYCDVYRAIYPEVVRLEGLRLLKWGSDDCLPV